MACGSAASSVVTRDLDAVAGGEDHGLGDAFARLQVGQRRGQRLLAEGEALAHLDGRGLVAHACDQQLHCLSRRLPSRACAAQVTAEKPTTVTVMMAALRPRHPGGDAQEDHAPDRCPR